MFGRQKSTTTFQQYWPVRQQYSVLIRVSFPPSIRHFVYIAAAQATALFRLTELSLRCATLQ